MKAKSRSHHRQQGVALVIFAIGLVVIIGIAGFALELSHAMLDDARIQNGMDACALSGAKELMEETGNGAEKRTAALAAAQETFTEFMDDHDSKLAALAWGDIEVTFSETLKGTFSTTEDSPRYVRCEAADYSISTRLTRVFGIGTLGLHVSAVAGPVFIDNCNPAPLLVCGNPDDDCEFGDEDGSCYGFNVYQEDNEDYVEEKCYLKACPPNKQCDDLDNGKVCGLEKGAPTGGGNPVADVSPGNFELLDFTCVSGKTGTPCIKEAFTEGGGVIEGGCPADGSKVTTKPGNTVSVIDAFNDIFAGLPGGDSNSTEPLLYSDYSNNIPTAGNGRRVLGVVIGDCTDGDIKPGKTEVPVLTVGCFFATDMAVKGGGTPVIWGQFIDQCQGTGPITKTPDVFDIFKIVLYKDYQGPDS